MAALRYLAPEFLNEGRLCWLRSPLYIVKDKKNESYFFTDEEFDAARGKIKGEVTRAKGLGAVSAEQAKRSMFNEQYQRLEILMPDAEAIMLLEELMGDNIDARREYIFENVDFSKIRE